MDAPIRLPQGTQRLFDLIRPKDPIFRPAFYMALRDTLVTDNWDLATRVAYEGDRVRWRIVTTTGNLIDTSGSMTGGGKPPSSGGMKAQCAKSTTSTVTVEQINQLDAEVTNLQTELSQCRNEITTVERELKEVDNQFKKIQMELEKSDFQLSRINSEKQDLLSRLSGLQSSTTLTREEVAEKKGLERKLIEVCQRIDEMSPNRSQLQAKVKETQQRILEVGGPGLKRAQAKVDSVSSEYAACQGSLSAKEVAMTSAVKQQTKTINSLRKAENDLKLSLEKKENLETEHQEMESAAAVVLQAQERAKQAALAKETELKEFTDDYRKLEGTVKLIKEVEVDLRSNYENCNKLLKENQSKRNGLMKELEKVRKHHEEDIKEFHIFFETPTVGGAGSGGEEETKGEEEEKAPEVAAQVSEVIQPLKVYTADELVETLGVPSSDGPLHVPQIAPGNKRSRGKKQQMVERNEDGDEGSTNNTDDPKRPALDRLKGEINLLEADRDRY
jgi:structural maintenance of chromosome 4